ncbi:MAG: PqqD family protein [Thermodesulfobacteriota bacterium]
MTDIARITMETTPSRDPRVSWRVIDDEAVIISGERMRVLNEVGTFVWQMLDGENPVAFICKSVADDFQIEEDAVFNDLQDFLTSLLEKEMIKV